VLLALGCSVSGSDLARTDLTDRLERLGARISYGHDRDNVLPGLDAVVISSAVKFANPRSRGRAISTFRSFRGRRCWPSS
jgi:UDP-N-acetylmuramate--alanine ligase